MKEKGGVNVYSKDYTTLVRRLEIEIQKNRLKIKTSEMKNEERNKEIALEYIKYHEETIRFIKKLDKELKEE